MCLVCPDFSKGLVSGALSSKIALLFDIVLGLYSLLSRTYVFTIFSGLIVLIFVSNLLYSLFGSPEVGRLTLVELEFAFKLLHFTVVVEIELFIQNRSLDSSNKFRVRLLTSEELQKDRI